MAKEKGNIENLLLHSPEPYLSFWAKQRVLHLLRLCWGPSLAPPLSTPPCFHSAEGRVLSPLVTGRCPVLSKVFYSSWARLKWNLDFWLVFSLYLGDLLKC